MYLHAPEFRCYVSDDGIIYWDQIERLSSEPRTPLPQQQQQYEPPYLPSFASHRPSKRSVSLPGSRF